MVWGVVIDGRLAHVESAGVRDRASNAPITAATEFRIASMTKSFTVLAILKLRDEAKLSLEDPVSKWLPEFARMELPTRDTAPLRIRQLLVEAMCHLDTGEAILFAPHDQGGHAERRQAA